MNARYFFFMYLICNGVCHAQLSIPQFLRSASADRKVLGIRDQINYLNEKPYRLSPVQRLEFRTQNKELVQNQQQYALRVMPANPWEVKNNKEYFEAYAVSLKIERDLEFKAALLARYHAVIDYTYHIGLRALGHEKEKLIKNELQVLEQQSASSYFDADDYIDLQMDEFDASVESEEADFELIAALSNVKQLYTDVLVGEMNWFDSDLITADEIRNVIDSISNTTLTNLSVAYQQQKIALATSAYKLKRSNVNVGFLQTQFDQKNFEQNKTPYNISLGITIPIVNPNKGDMARRKLDVIEAENGLEATKIIQQSDYQIRQEKIVRLLARYQQTEKKLQLVKQSKLASTVSTMKGGDPRVILRFNENQIKLNIVLLKLRREVLMAYIDFLASADRLQQLPLVNYLSPALDQF
jgi:hypothetical protein